MSPDEIQSVLPELPRLVDEWQTGAIDEASHQQLTELLRSRWDVRQYFLEQCQIDAELRWRFSSQQQIAGTLSRHGEGSARPVAAIVLSGLGFRDDPGFPAVFNKIEGCESLAHQWLHCYLTLRACSFLCSPRFSQAEAAVKAICDELAHHPLANLTPERFVHLACEITCRTLTQRFQGKSGGGVQAFTSIVHRCFQLGETSDVVAIYETFEECVPRHVPAATLRLLGMRYLLEKSPAKIAASLNAPEPVVRSRLAQVQLQIWKSCAVHQDTSEVPEELRQLSTVVAVPDQLAASENVVIDGRQMSRERFWHGLDVWAGGSEAACRQFLTFAILQEALFRRLTLNHLLEVSKTRRDEEFHLVVTEMVLHLEETSVRTPRVPETPRRVVRTRLEVGWWAATAAALLIAVGAGLWWSGKPPSAPQARLVTDRSPPPVESPHLRPSASRATVANVKASIITEGLEQPTFIEGTPIYADEEITLESGILHLSTPSGSEWVLEGPISVVMKEGDEISLTHGKLVGLNQADGLPLVVQTPSARVLDKGTEFGVRVSDNGATSVAVYEGAVALSSTAGSDSRGITDRLLVEANFEASVTHGGTLPPKADPSPHDRAFIRPDEVALRQAQQQGSVDAAEKVAFYELLRVDGLLAYQGFDSASRGEAFMVGFLPPRAQGPWAFGEDLGLRQTKGTPSASLLLSNGSTIFLDFDVSERSPIKRAGLLDSMGFVGGREMEVWLCWRSKSSLLAGRRFKWTGLSVMHGDNRQSEEPAFIGQPSDTAYLGMQIFSGEEEMIQHFNTDPSAPEARTIASDDRPHVWVARIAIEPGGHGTVSGWCDVEPANIDATPPHAVQEVDNLKFDRLRLEVSTEGDKGECAYDEVYLTASLESLIEAMSRRHQEASP